MVVVRHSWLSEYVVSFFFFNDTATTEIYTLSLHDALPICTAPRDGSSGAVHRGGHLQLSADGGRLRRHGAPVGRRSEEHTSELQSRQYLVCRLLLEKKNQTETQGHV